MKKHLRMGFLTFFFLASGMNACLCIYLDRTVCSYLMTWANGIFLMQIFYTHIMKWHWTMIDKYKGICEQYENVIDQLTVQLKATARDKYINEDIH